MEFLVYYKTEGLMFRSYNYLTTEYKTISRLPTDISNFYLPKCSKKYICDDESLKRYATDLYNARCELLKYTKFDYIQPYKNTIRNHNKCIESFFKMYSTDDEGKQLSANFKPINREEANLFSKCYNGSVQYLKQGEYNIFGYDYKGFYQSLLVDKDFYFPHCSGTFKTLKKIPEKPMLGFYFVNISCDDENFKKIFMFSKDNVYTSYSLKFAMKYKDKFNVNVQLCEHPNNAYVYDRKKECVLSKTIFNKWSNKLNSLKSKIPNNILIKMLSSSVWGHLSKKKKYTMTEAQTFEVNADWDDEAEYKIIDFITKDNGDEFYKVVKQDEQYYHNFRLKPFITSYGRVKIAELAIKAGLENIVRIHTDSICSLKEFDYKSETNLIPEQKSTGKFKLEAINKTLVRIE